jgi:hypothetical protein
MVRLFVPPVRVADCYLGYRCREFVCLQPSCNPAQQKAVPQGLHFRKLAISRSPSVWLFSGWNCVPATFPVATIAVTEPP